MVPSSWTQMRSGTMSSLSLHSSHGSASSRSIETSRVDGERDVDPGDGDRAVRPLSSTVAARLTVSAAAVNPVLPALVYPTSHSWHPHQLQRRRQHCDRCCTSGVLMCWGAARRLQVIPAPPNSLNRANAASTAFSQRARIAIRQRVPRRVTGQRQPRRERGHLNGRTAVDERDAEDLAQPGELTRGAVPQFRVLAQQPFVCAEVLTVRRQFPAQLHHDRAQLCHRARQVGDR